MTASECPASLCEELILGQDADLAKETTFLPSVNRGLLCARGTGLLFKDTHPFFISKVPG